MCLSPFQRRKSEKASAVNCGPLSLFLQQSIRSEETSENVTGLLSGGASRGNDLQPL